MGRLGLLLTACFLMAELPASRGAETAPVPIGTPIADLRFKDIRYLPRSLSELGEASATVIVFANTTCPIAQKYWPRLKKLEAEFRPRGVQFLALNASEGDSIADVAEQAIDYGLPFPVGKDSDGSVARALGVERTPEVVVLDSQRKLRYRGRIDDQYRLGGARPTATTHELAEALEAVVSRREPRVTSTPVDGCRITFATRPELPFDVNYSEHVAAILDAKCVECHRPQGGAPFPLTSFEEARSQAAMIGEVVADQRMPPWYASHRQKFVNQRELTRRERDLLIAWAGRPEQGDETRRPPAPSFPPVDWEIGTPDLVTTSLQEHALPAEGFIDYRYDILPYVFLQETWISAAEIRPSNPAVVHHCNLAYMAVGQDFSDQNFITGRVPGGTAMILDDGVAYRIPAGSVVGLQIHYTTTGKPEKNRMSVGFRFPKAPVRRQLHHEQVQTKRFAIPPGDPAHEVKAVRALKGEAEGVGMFAHMHLRGKDMTFRALYPDGTTESLLSIPNYHYDWQQNYRWAPGAKQFPPGTKIEVTAHFDNSKFNSFNPDASKTVRFGPQTVDEMMYGFFFYTLAGEDLNLRIDPRTGVKAEP